MAADYYELLGVGHDASEDELKRAYRQRARELHPDSTGGDQRRSVKFKETTARLRGAARSRAQAPLRHVRSRRRRRVGPERWATYSAGIWATFSGRSSAGAAAAQRAYRAGPAGSDAETVLTLTFHEAVFGASKEMTRRHGGLLRRRARAAGRGRVRPRPGATTAAGAGEVRRVRQSILGQVVTAFPCNRCGGNGEVVTSPCPDCRGEGRPSETEDLHRRHPRGRRPRLDLAPGRARIGGPAGRARRATSTSTWLWPPTRGSSARATTSW